jgi:hypothetical protein
MRQLKMKKRYKTHPAHNQNRSSNHSENCADDDDDGGIGTKWYSVVSRLFIHQVCPLMYSWSTHTEEAKSMKCDVATNDDDSISPLLSKCGRVQCFFGWSC